MTEAIDRMAASGKLIFDMFGARDKFERSVIVERTRAGLKASAIVAEKAGARCPSTADLEAAKTLLRDPTITVKAVATRLKVSPPTLYRHLPGGRGSIEGQGEVSAQEDHRD